MPIRVVVWGTGWVGSKAIGAIVRRPDLQLVGVWVHSPEKAGVDAGVLAGIGPLGLTATTDTDVLIALAPDCICYAASGPGGSGAAEPDYVRFLEAGINVVTVSSAGWCIRPASARPPPTYSKVRLCQAGPRSTRPVSNRDLRPTSSY